MQVLWLLMLVIIVFNFEMSIWRAPMIALMPDLMPDSQRSAANGVINLMGGIASTSTQEACHVDSRHGGRQVYRRRSNVQRCVALRLLSYGAAGDIQRMRCSSASLRMNW